MPIDKKTLYVTDLDGTLLNHNQALSEYTKNTINSLIEQGMAFSYATARSYVTASKVTTGISPKIPVIVYNGAFILESGTQEILLANYFDFEDVANIKHILTEHAIYPIIYAYINNEEKFSYCNEHVTPGMKVFIESRSGDARENIAPLNRLYDGEVFYFTCIDNEQKLLPVYNSLSDTYNCIYQKDIYSGSQWLEIMPQKATKANAILQLKNLLNCERIISFGDGKNDISMFSISDECYAVENAAHDLKQYATAVIEDNDHDGVAKWLASNCK